jgi:hypothetical protein
MDKKYKIVIELEHDNFQSIQLMEKLIREAILKTFFIEPKITKLTVNEVSEDANSK